MAESEQFLGTYLGVVRGLNGGPDQVVMVEIVREDDGRSEEAEAELEGVPFDHRKYFDNSLGSGEISDQPWFAGAGEGD